MKLQCATGRATPITFYVLMTHLYRQSSSFRLYHVLNIDSHAVYRKSNDFLVSDGNQLKPIINDEPKNNHRTAHTSNRFDLYSPGSLTSSVYVLLSVNQLISRRLFYYIYIYSRNAPRRGGRHCTIASWCMYSEQSMRFAAKNLFQTKRNVVYR